MREAIVHGQNAFLSGGCAAKKKRHIGEDRGAE